MDTESTQLAAVNLILGELSQALRDLNASQLTSASGKILAAKNVFLTGAGRSGLALRMVAMRLMHLGLSVHVAGEVTAPALAAGDLLIVASASGMTSGPVHAAEVARKVGAEVLAITTAPGSKLGQLATARIVLRAGTRQEQSSASAQYAGALFEQSVLLLMDALFQTMWQADGQTAEQLSARHANLE